MCQFKKKYLMSEDFNVRLYLGDELLEIGAIMLLVSVDAVN